MQLFDSLTRIMLKTVLMIKSSNISFYIFLVYSFLVLLDNGHSNLYSIHFYVNF